MHLYRRLLLLPALLRSAIAYATLSDVSLQSIPAPGHDFDIKDGALLSPILVPRVPGTPGSDAVLTHLANFFRENLPDWKLSFQNSTSTTPASNGKEVPFKNLIATRDPPWLADREGEVGRLALVAHYDSLSTPQGFIGATDSAAPCAMLLHIARSIDAALTKKWQAMEAQHMVSDDFEDMEDHRGVQILLLDGEEAFVSWTATDSIYGARSLAAEWDSTLHPAMSTYPNPLSSIDLFVLLDLLGSSNPSVPSYFKTTHWAYQNLATLEARLRKLGKFKSAAPTGGDEVAFLPEAHKSDNDRWLGGFIGDDHQPFLERGVQILHVIPSPFPAVWHKMEDDGEHLDLDVCEDWAVLVAAFAAEWMELEGHLDVREKNERRWGEEKKSELLTDEIG